MIRRLLTGFYLTKLHAGVLCGGAQHFYEQIVRHKVRTGAGSQISSPGKRFHGAEIYLLVPLCGALHGLSRFRECGRVEYDKIKFFVLLLKLREQVENILHSERHSFRKSVCLCVALCHFYGGF